MDLSREKKFGLCIHSAVGVHMMSVMEETQGKQKSPGLCDWEGRDGAGGWARATNCGHNGSKTCRLTLKSRKGVRGQKVKGSNLWDAVEIKEKKKENQQAAGS